MVNPASRQMSTSLVASSTPLSPHALKNSFPPPNVPVPKVRTGTLKPEPPKNLYSIKGIYRFWRGLQPCARLRSPALDPLAINLQLSDPLLRESPLIMRPVPSDRQIADSFSKYRRPGRSESLPRPIPRHPDLHF